MGWGRDLLSRGRRTLDLVNVLAPRELRVRYRQSALDITWALISPVAILAVYGVVLTQSFDVTTSCGPYLSSAWVGLVIWTFFATAVGTGVLSLITSADLVTKVYFPREALPLSMVGASLADLGIGVVTVLILLPIQGVAFTWVGFAAALPILVVVVWAATISVIVAVAAAFVRDVPHAVQLGLRVGFFATPVMYDSSLIPPALQWSATINPIAAAITGFRDTMVCHSWPDVPLLLTHLAVGLVVLVGAVVYTRSIEARMTDVV
jgi:ABC-type polysaccharide/polyol phosphate export permease